MAQTVVLPWPPAVLSPNGRAHWSRKAKAAAQAREAACLLCQAAGMRALPWRSMAVRITFQPPSRRRMDLDNTLSRCKSLLDGVADATGVDDSRWAISMRWGEPVKGGAVQMELREAKP